MLLGIVLSFGVLVLHTLNQNSVETIGFRLLFTRVVCCLVNAFWGPLWAMCFHCFSNDFVDFSVFYGLLFFVTFLEHGLFKSIVFSNGCVHVF